MCKADGESIDHLFLHCPRAYDLWSFGFLGSCHVGFVGKVHLGGNRVMKFGSNSALFIVVFMEGEKFKDFLGLLLKHS